MIGVRCNSQLLTRGVSLCPYFHVISLTSYVHENKVLLHNAWCRCLNVFANVKEWQKVQIPPPSIIFDNLYTAPRVRVLPTASCRAQWTGCRWPLRADNCVTPFHGIRRRGSRADGAVMDVGGSGESARRRSPPAGLLTVGVAR